MPTANIAPASAPEFQSYDRHECLYKFLMMKPFSASDFTKEMKLFPKEGRFFNSLCYMGVYKNTGITDFSAWLTECTAAVKSIASACGRILRSDAERDLYAWGLAVHTFVFDDTHSQLPIDEELLFRIFDIPPDTEEALWALYQIGAAALDKMEYTPREGRNLSLFTRLLMETLRIKDDFETLKTVHYDTEKGIINYG